ncbi:redox-regulated ATPase YchF [Candidatus Alkanophaga liquidiphilum]|nr:Ribosome-binding ATPase YchF [Candidatus Alkanophaga liquidiphilum]RLG36729.1 MAG: redox-regulated ATPase YchF [Candidatus Alkanophagales archaeon]
MITLAIAGKPNSGKSTFFKASTLIDVEIAPYPFTTVSPNVGITHVRTKCVCKELLGEFCGNCVRGERFIPVELIDVAGLVKDAHKGRGLGNEFLDNLRRAESIIHVVDASGSTDADGNIVNIGSHDPVEDVAFFEEEIRMWVFGIIQRNWRKVQRRIELEGAKAERLLTEQLAGVGITETQMKAALSKTMKTANGDVKNWDDDALKTLATHVVEESKKMLIAANKMDIAPKEFLERLKALDRIVIPCSAEMELALRTAAKNNIIKYLAGDSDFEIIADVTNAQRAALERMRRLLREFGSSGVQECINRAVFDLLDHIVVYPVEDENKLCDSVGRTLPDAFLMKRGSTARDLAFAVHTEIGQSFLYAVDARTKRRLSADYALKNNDVIKIVHTR